MIEIDFTMDDVLRVENPEMQRSLSEDAVIISDDRYILAHDVPYYQKENDWVVMQDTAQKDEYGYSKYPISYFLGCDGASSSFKLEEDVAQGNYSFVMHCVVDGSVI